MDVFEDPVTNMVIATLELPGVSQDKIAIDVFDDRLTISGEVASYFGENCDYILRERRTGSFVRTLALPANIPVSHKSARLRHICGSLIVYDCGFDHRLSPSKLLWKTEC
ncbi:hypothetical protein BDM02DRAFT_3113065 [Thelephora ganbajun]|uniref:Uncharacterized protein n=1 Tax=Thelephora ganbajun TaxID=370292 RepID=A0ACB6ZJJ1_THEGA|nr:hypothetical protein BDM02DRAFT_3113065 [Thelephora ganbajun]